MITNWPVNADALEAEKVKGRLNPISCVGEMKRSYNLTHYGSQQVVTVRVGAVDYNGQME